MQKKRMEPHCAKPVFCINKFTFDHKLIVEIHATLEDASQHVKNLLFNSHSYPFMFCSFIYFFHLNKNNNKHL